MITAARKRIHRVRRRIFVEGAWLTAIFLLQLSLDSCSDMWTHTYFLDDWVEGEEGLRLLKPFTHLRKAMSNLHRTTTPNALTLIFENKTQEA
jgi:hypothetical protein